MLRPSVFWKTLDRSYTEQKLSSLALCKAVSWRYRIPSQATRTIALQSKMKTLTSLEKEGRKAGVKIAVRVKDVTGAISAVSGAVQPEVELAFQMRKVAKREYRFVRVISSSKLESLHELVTTPALHRNVNVMLANPPITFAVRGSRLAPLTMCFPKRTLRTL